MSLEWSQTLIPPPPTTRLRPQLLLLQFIDYNFLKTVVFISSFFLLKTDVYILLRSIYIFSIYTHSGQKPQFFQNLTETQAV